MTSGSLAADIDRALPEPIAPQRPDRTALNRAVLQALAYADVFDYPLTAKEVHRYLIGLPASPFVVEEALDSSELRSRFVGHHAGYYTLRDRETIIANRQRRAQVAERVWPRAVTYGRIIARLPFVRMVAVTGTLAVDNVESDADIDYLIITAPGRLWLCRALIIALVRLSALRGDTICPNYLLSERAMVLDEHTLYTAHELVQMVPIAGMRTYQRLRQLNPWYTRFLPNAGDPPPRSDQRPLRFNLPRKVAEASLQTAPGAWIERWEMERKIRKFSRTSTTSAEYAFAPDWCKGHFEGHGERILNAYAERVRVLEESV